MRCYPRLVFVNIFYFLVTNSFLIAFRKTNDFPPDIIKVRLLCIIYLLESGRGHARGQLDAADIKVTNEITRRNKSQNSDIKVKREKKCPASVSDCFLVDFVLYGRNVEKSEFC